MIDEELQDRSSDTASPAGVAAVDVESPAVEGPDASPEDGPDPTVDAPPTEPGSEPEAAVEPEPEPAVEAEAVVEGEALAGVEPGPDPAREPAPEAEALADVEPGPEPAREPAPEAGSGSELEVVAAVPEPPSAPPVPVTAGRYIADALRAAGVKFAFTVPGESFLGLLDALEDAGIKVIATRHEGAAAFMAEAYGQLTGRPAACLATRAVGAANLSIGIHTARQDSTPLFALVGQVDRDVRGREAFQEVDQVDSFGRLAKWAVEVDRPAGLPEAMGEAVRRALSGRPGPVLISLPEDLLDEEMQPGGAPVARRMTAPPPDNEELGAVLRLLTDARRPVILAGAGVLRARATSDLVRLAEILEIPVVAAWRRPDVFPNDHRLYLGMTGYAAPASVRERMLAADGVLVIGCRLNEVASFGYAVPAAGARWAHVDLEPRRAHAGLSAPDIAIGSDARTFLRAARERLAGAVHDAASFDERRANNESDRAAYEAGSVVDGGAWDGPGVHPGRVVATLQGVLPLEAILTTDAGNFGQWAARGFRFRRPGTFIGPTSGAMGYGLPAAIAASLVHRDRPVVALTGDGGFAMTMAELETAVRERLRTIVLVFDNARFGTIRAHQALRGTGVGVATELGPIDFAAIGRALGANGVYVEDDTAFEPALREALAADRPTVIHLAMDPRWVGVDEPAIGGVAVGTGAPPAGGIVAGDEPEPVGESPMVDAPALTDEPSIGERPGVPEEPVAIAEPPVVDGPALTDDRARLPTVSILTVYGYDWCDDTSASRAHLEALGVPFRYVNMDEDAGAKATVTGAGYTSTPTIVTPGGVIVVEPSDAELDTLVATLG